jgi:hypothetical protein
MAEHPRDRDRDRDEEEPRPERGHGAEGEDDGRPLADRRSGPPPGPDTEIAGEREPSESDPPVQRPKGGTDEPPERPTRA